MKLSDFLACVGKPFSYYPKIADKLGSVDAAVLLCAIIWRDRDRHDDKFLKTIDQLQIETGLSERSMRTARDLLEELKILKSEYLRADHITSFEIDLERLEEVIGAPVKTSDATTEGHLSKRQMPVGKTSDEHLAKRQVDPLYENKNETNEKATSEEVHLEMELLRWMEKAWRSLLPKHPWPKKGITEGTCSWLRTQETVIGSTTFRSNWLEYLSTADKPHPVGFAKAMEPECKGRPRSNGNGHFKPHVPPVEDAAPDVQDTSPALPDAVQQMREERGEEWYKGYQERVKKEMEDRRSQFRK